MFLKEFAIRRYGPLADSGKRELGAFNLFYGPNEEGKTLTIDALLKMLFGKAAARYFEAVKRVEEIPDGYLVIGESAKKDLKLPEAGTVPDLFGLGVSEFSNIFVIRDSDLSINDEGDFYRGVTARLTGMRSEEIGKIKDRLLELGRITAGGDFQNRDPYKLKDRFKKARLLLEKTEPLLEKMEEEEFSFFEEELARLVQDCRDSTEKLGQFRAARGREDYEKGREALKKMLKAVSALNDLKSYNQDDYESWQRAEMSIEHLRNDHLNLEAEIDNKKKVLTAARSAKQGKAVAFRKTGQELQEARGKIEPLLTEYDRQHDLLIRQETLVNNRQFSLIVMIGILLLFLSLAGAIFRPSWWLFLILSVSSLLAITGGWLRISMLNKKSLLNAVEAEAAAKAEELGLDSGDIHAVRVSFGRLESETALAAESLTEAEKEAEWQQKELDRTTERLEEKIRRIRELEENINRMRQSLAIDTRDKFAALLKLKQDLGSEINVQKNLLESQFGRNSDLTSEDAHIRFWTEQVEELSRFASAVPDLKYDKQAVARLTAEIEKMDQQKKELQDKMKERLDELRDIEKEANELLYFDEEGYLPCQTALDLEMVRQMIQDWIARQEDNKEAAMVALEIFTELEVEEEQKVTALFGEDSPVSSYFSKITGERYREVLFESRDNPIKTVRHDGVEFDAANLSGGTYDQLYFAIRLALGEKLLEGGKGFFILDDPFIKADPVRLETLVAMLFEICAAGWQILYFSSKGEVKEALKKKIAAGAVKEFSIGPG